MKTLSPLVLFLAFISFSCSKVPEGPTHQSKTLRLTNTSMRKIVDLQLDGAIFLDEQRGRNNEELIGKLKELASSRQETNIERHLLSLKELVRKESELDLQHSFDRADLYMKDEGTREAAELLKVEINNIEFVLVQHWSRQLGIIDCCFPSLIKVQTNGSVDAGEPYEMAIFPNGEKALWEHTSYSYDDIYLTQSGKKVSVVIENNRIGHVMILRFTLTNSGAYLLHFSVTESGEFLEEPWQQDFEWPVEVR